MDKSNLGDNLLLGMGNPLLDISTTVDKEFLAKYQMKENDAILADDRHKNLYSELVENYNADYIAGGSVQNSLRVAQWLLEKPNVTTFFGCVGNDKNSKTLRDKAILDGVNVQYQYNDKEPTGTCAVLITGTHRSLCANLAAANCFTIDHIKKEENKKLIDTAKFFYISGFFLTVSPPSIMEVAKQALAHDREFLMNLSAPFISQYYKEPLKQVMPYVDVIFGNDTEAETFAETFSAELENFNTKNLKEIALAICNFPKQNLNRKRVCILTRGNKPVIVAREDETTKKYITEEYPVISLPEDKIVDTNGAGDAFAGGFLSQYIQRQDIAVCVKCGIWAATEIIQRSGCTYEGKATFDP